MANSAIYFITYEIFGAKFVKIGRSCDVKKRRNELQGGCPVELAIEHVKVLPGEDAIDTERRWQALFETM